jgi:hypothetical protein
MLTHLDMFLAKTDSDSCSKRTLSFCVTKKDANLFSALSLLFSGEFVLSCFCILCFLFSILFLQELTLVLPVAGALNLYNDRVVEDTIKYSTGRDRITKELGPVLLFDVGYIKIEITLSLFCPFR